MFGQRRFYSTDIRQVTECRARAFRVKGGMLFAKIPLCLFDCIKCRFIRPAVY